jgi:hypothetical protein
MRPKAGPPAGPIELITVPSNLGLRRGRRAALSPRSLQAGAHSAANMRTRGIVIGALACAACVAAPQRAPSARPGPTAGPVIHIEDVDRFYKLYDGAGGQPTGDQLQRDYIDPGSDGLHQFARARNISGARIAEALGRQPEIYSNAKQCMVVLPRVRERLEVALRTLSRLYPEARLPPVTIAVGRGRPG